MAFAQLEPFGFRGNWMPFAMLASQQCNLNLPKGKKKAKVDDFMPKEQAEEQTWEDMLKHARTVTEMFGKKFS